MQYQWIDHDADMLLEVAADSCERLFECAGTALLEALWGVPPSSESQFTSEIRLQCEDKVDLLVAWLNELLFLSETGNSRPRSIERFRLAGNNLHAFLICETKGAGSEPVRDIKAATYHDLAVEEVGGEWRARIVFDV